MDYFLPRIQTPKILLLLLDFEHGASSDVNANTETILYGMRRIKQRGTRQCIIHTNLLHCNM